MGPTEGCRLQGLGLREFRASGLWLRGFSVWMFWVKLSSQAVDNRRNSILSSALGGSPVDGKAPSGVDDECATTPAKIEILNLTRRKPALQTKRSKAKSRIIGIKPLSAFKPCNLITS